MDKIKKIPVPIAGLVLGLAALGNLIQTYSEGVRLALGAISGLLFILLTLKIITNFEGFKTDLENPVVAAVFATYSMAIMLLSTYLKPFIGESAKFIWLFGVVLHIAIILFFTVRFALKKNIKMVTAAWFIPYVGIAVASITAPAFKMLSLGQGAFWFGLVCYVILLPIVLYRIHAIGEIPAPAIPTSAIVTAPGSLLLAGYMNSFAENKNMAIVYGLLVVSQVLFLYVLANLPKLINRPFIPSFSSFTFPFAITGIALKLTNGFLTKSNQAIPVLKYLVKFEELLAFVLIIYVLVKYLAFIFQDKKAA